ncbi:MAG TPA: hypothetical protein VJM34_04595 [Novosphingobium sp.]|nr:hypothetical protein [Novosphingobium sp.]
MSVRTLLTAAMLSATMLSTPAFAQDPARDEAADRADEIAARLHDPATQLMVAGAIAAASEALLDTSVEPIARAMRSAGADPHLPRDARVRDIAGPDAERARDRAVGEVPRAMSRAGEMASALGDMVPEFRAMAKRMKDAVPHY